MIALYFSLCLGVGVKTAQKNKKIRIAIPNFLVKLDYDLQT
jgi:hypothetical protein